MDEVVGMDLAVVAQKMIEGLGGPYNVLSVEGCITRLRVTVADPDRVDQGVLRDGGAMAVIAVGEAIQVVVGPQAEDLADAANAAR